MFEGYRYEFEPHNVHVEDQGSQYSEDPLNGTVYDWNVCVSGTILMEPHTTISYTLQLKVWISCKGDIVLKQTDVIFILRKHWM